MSLTQFSITDAPSLLSLSTSRLMNATIQEGLSQLTSIRVHITTEKPLDTASLLHEPFGFIIHCGEDKRAFHGMIISISNDLARQGAPFDYHMTLMPEVAQLMHINRSHIYTQLSVIDIVKQRLAEQHIPPMDTSQLAQQSYPLIPYLTQYQESDWHFIERILSAHRIHYYFSYQHQQHTLHLLDQPLWQKSSLSKPLPAAKQQQRFRSRPAEYQSNHYDPGQVEANNAQSSKTNISQPSEIHAPLCQATHHSLPSALVTQPELTDHLTHLANTDHEPITTTGDDPRTAVSELIQVSTLNKTTEAIVLAVTHHATQAPDQTGQSLLHAYNNQITYSLNTELPATKHLTTPHTPGPQPATVVGPQHNHVYTNKLGCIKVQFHWQDKASVTPIEQSTWIRTQHALAGNQYGSLHIPRVGTEVLVDFIHGDINEPIVVAQLHQDDAPPSYAPHQADSINTLRTQTLGSTDLAQHNEIAFNDSAPELLLHANRDYITTTGNDHQANIDGDQRITVNQGDYSYTVQSGEFELEAKQGITFTAGNHSIRMTPESISIEADNISLN